MGLLSIVKAPFKLAGKMIPKPEKNYIKAIITTKRPEPYQYYYDGHPTTFVGDNLIVWEKNVSQKDREKALQKLGQVM